MCYGGDVGAKWRHKCNVGGRFKKTYGGDGGIMGGGGIKNGDGDYRQ